jgi:hypothetical protein
MSLCPFASIDDSSWDLQAAILLIIADKRRGLNVLAKTLTKWLVLFSFLFLRLKITKLI